MVSGVEAFRLPFNDRWFVMHGGDTLSVNHHMRARAQWYAIDFMKTGGLHQRQRQLFRTDGKALEDFFSWGETVRSPVNGKLEIVVDDLPDNPIGSSDKQNICGNHVVIRTKTERYVFIAHLQR